MSQEMLSTKQLAERYYTELGPVRSLKFADRLICQASDIKSYLISFVFHSAVVCIRGIFSKRNGSLARHEFDALYNFEPDEIAGIMKALENIPKAARGKVFDAVCDPNYELNQYKALESYFEVKSPAPLESECVKPTNDQPKNAFTVGKSADSPEKQTEFLDTMIPDINKIREANRIAYGDASAPTFGNNVTTPAPAAPVSAVVSGDTSVSTSDNSPAATSVTSGDTTFEKQDSRHVPSSLYGGEPKDENLMPTSNFDDAYQEKMGSNFIEIDLTSWRDESWPLSWWREFLNEVIEANRGYIINKTATEIAYLSPSFSHAIKEFQDLKKSKGVDQRNIELDTDFVEKSFTTRLAAILRDPKTELDDYRIRSTKDSKKGTRAAAYIITPINSHDNIKIEDGWHELAKNGYHSDTTSANFQKYITKKYLRVFLKYASTLAPTQRSKYRTVFQIQEVLDDKVKNAYIEDPGFKFLLDDSGRMALQRELLEHWAYGLTINGYVVEAEYNLIKDVNGEITRTPDTPKFYIKKA